VKAATLHRSDFVQQNAANTKTNIFDCFISYFIHACSKANVRNFFFGIFPYVFQLLVWSVQTDMVWRPDMLGSIDLLSDSMPSGRVYTTSEPELFAFSAKNTHFFLLVLSCCVVCVFSQTDPEILAFSAHLFSFPGISFDFSYSLKLWFFGIFNWLWFKRLCMNIFFCLYAGWILLICAFWIAISTFVFLYASNW